MNRFYLDVKTRPYHSRLRIWSCETVSAVPSRVSLLILHTQKAESGANSRDRFPRRYSFIFVCRHTTSGQSRVYQITYDSDGRVLLWEVLARFGVPPRRIKDIRMFRDGMRARVQLDHRYFSAWFNVFQGLRQGCVFSPLLFNIFLAAVIIVVLKRFAEDPLIISDLVFLDDAAKGEDCRHREEGTLEMNRRTVWGMLYADAAGVVSTSPRGLTSMMDSIVVAYQESGLTVSEKKTEVMYLCSHPIPASTALRVEPAGQQYKQTR